MKGHRRIVIPVDPSPIRNRAPLGGWNMSCICGWDGGNWPDSKSGRKLYREHLNHQIDDVPVKCKRCGIPKPPTQMRPDYRYICLDCFSKIGNEWQRNNPKESTRHKRNHSYLKLYGMTLDEVEQMLTLQGGLCAICQHPIGYSTKRGLNVDHDHITGKVRGLLCFGCNNGLGNFKDDPQRLAAAIKYLRKESNDG